MAYGPRALAAACAVGICCACNPIDGPPATAGTPGPARAQAAYRAPAEAYASLFVAELMAFQLDPAAGVVLAAGERANQPDAAPPSHEAWQAVVDAAGQLRSHAATLARPAMTGGRADWLALASALVDSSGAGAEAARRRDTAALAAASRGVRAACDGCHARYAPDQR